MVNDAESSLWPRQCTGLLRCQKVSTLGPRFNSSRHLDVPDLRPCYAWWKIAAAVSPALCGAHSTPLRQHQRCASISAASASISLPWPRPWRALLRSRAMIGARLSAMSGKACGPARSLRGASRRLSCGLPPSRRRFNARSATATGQGSKKALPATGTLS